MTVEEYGLAVNKLVQLMKLPTVNSDAEVEVAELLNTIDAYRTLDFLKVR